MRRKGVGHCTHRGKSKKWEGLEEGKRRKKIRRGRKNRNIYKKCRIYYVNMRGIKSKICSLEEILNTVKPSILCLTETHMGKEERIEISGYKLFTNNRNREGGGVLIGVCEEIGKVAVEIKREEKTFESVWIKIDNGKLKVRVGVIYAPQESKTTLKEIEEMYRSIKDEMREAEIHKEKVMIWGDFKINCKIGNAIPGNNEEVTKGGKVLKKLVKDLNLRIVNADTKCEGIWTRKENEKRSVLDYGLIREGDEEGIIKMFIDEEKLYTPYRMTKHITYMDHCAMLLDMDWDMASRNQVAEDKMVLDLKKFKANTESTGLTNIAREKISLAEKYTKWQKEVNRIMAKCERKAKKGGKSVIKSVRHLMTQKRNIKKKRLNETDGERKRLLRVQERLIDEYIVEENSKEQGDRIKKTVEEIKKSGGVNGAAFWDFKKKVDGQKENTRSAVRGKNGEMLENVQEIKREFEEFYINLFMDNEPLTREEKTAEEINSMMIEWAVKNKVPGEGLPKTKMAELERVVSNLKNKNTRDRESMSNRMIKNMGTDMKESLKILINDIEEQIQTPVEWDKMGILSVKKGKGSNLSLDNRRGLFITYTVSKIFERLRLDKVKGEINKKN